MPHFPARPAPSVSVSPPHLFASVRPLCLRACEASRYNVPLPVSDEARDAARVRAAAGAASAVMEVAAEEATTWGRDAMDDVAGDGTIDGDTPCLLGIEHRQSREIE